METPRDKTLNELLEERRKELSRLIAGALRHLGVDEHDFSVRKRRKIDVFDPEEAIFLIKADTVPALTPTNVSFIASSLAKMNYSVKRIEHRGDRLLLFV